MVPLSHLPRLTAIHDDDLLLVTDVSCRESKAVTFRDLFVNRGPHMRCDHCGTTYLNTTRHKCESCGAPLVELRR